MRNTDVWHVLAAIRALHTEVEEMREQLNALPAPAVINLTVQVPDDDSASTESPGSVQSEP